MEESKIDGGNSLRKRITNKLLNRKSLLELVCGKVLRINCRIGNRYLNWFAKKYCEKIFNRKLLLDLDCEKLIESEMLS